MLKAIHKDSGKLVESLRLETDPSWIGKGNETWLVPFASLDKEGLKKLKEEGIEPEVSFIKSHSRKNLVNKKFVTPHFKAKNEKINNAIKPESKEHKLAKQGILEECYNNNLIIEGEKIRDKFSMYSIDIEERLSPNNKAKIADVLYYFKKEDDRFGRGIVFEIQFSDQNEEITEERNYQRVLEGFSVVWLWDGNFDEHGELINKEIKIVPYTKAINQYKRDEYEKIREEINSTFQLADDKLEETKRIIEQNKNDAIFEIEDYKKDASSKYLDVINQSSNVSEKLKEEINQKLEDITGTSKEELKNSLKKIYTNWIRDYADSERIHNEIVEKILNSKLDDISNKIFNKIEIQEMKEKITNDVEKSSKKQIKEKFNATIIQRFTNEVIEKLEKWKKMMIPAEEALKTRTMNKLINQGEFEQAKKYWNTVFIKNKEGLKEWLKLN